MMAMVRINKTGCPSSHGGSTETALTTTPNHKERIMAKKSISSNAEERQDEIMSEDTYTQCLSDDLTLPLSLLVGFMRTIELSGQHDYGWPAIFGTLIENAEKNLKEISDALEDKFGDIEIVHENYDCEKALYPWGKVVGISNGEG